MGNPRKWRTPTVIIRLEGSSPKRAMASVRDTTGIEDRGTRIEGQLTNLGEPPVSLDREWPEDKGNRRNKSPGDVRAAPAQRRATGKRWNTNEGSSKVLGRERERTNPRWTEAVLAERSTDGRGEKTAAE